MSATTTAPPDEGPNTDTIPVQGGKERARKALAAVKGLHDGAADSRPKEWLLVALVALCQLASSVQIYELTGWTGHTGPLQVLPFVVLDGTALLLVAYAVDKTLPKTIRTVAAVIAFACFVASVACAALNWIVAPAGVLVPAWLELRAPLGVAFNVIPPLLLVPLGLVRLWIGAVRQTQRADAAAKARAQEQAWEQERQDRERRETERVTAEANAAAATAAAEKAAADVERERLRRDREDRKDREREEEPRPRAKKPEPEPEPAGPVDPDKDPAVAQPKRARRVALRMIVERGDGTVPAGGELEKAVGAAEGSGVGRRALSGLESEGAVSEKLDRQGTRTAVLDRARELHDAEVSPDPTGGVDRILTGLPGGRATG